MWDDKRRPQPTRFSRFSLALMTVAVLVVLIAGMVLLSQAAQRRNEEQAERETASVSAAVHTLHEGLLADVRRLAALDIDRRPSAGLGVIDRLLLVGETGEVSLQGGEGRGADSSDLDRAILDLVRPILDHKATLAGGMIAPGDLFDAAAVAAPGPGVGTRTQIVVGVRRVDERWLAEIAKGSGVEHIDLVYRAGESADPHAVTWSRSGWGGSGLTWQPARPGNQMMLRSTLVVMAITSFAAFIVILRGRRESKRLHESETRAVAASRNDWLSGLPNRVFFNHALERDLQAMKRRSGKLALLYVDVDRFKDLNDSFGLESGDLMLQAITRRMETVLEPGQSLARFEGDAFSLLLPGIDDARACEAFVMRLQAAMAAPFHLADRAMTITVSIGIALAPDDATERSELVRLATLALYRAKREGRNRHAFYEPDLHAAWRRRTAIEHALPEAIAQGGLVLLYQPIVDCRSGRVVGAEALVRWHHPDEGFIGPDDFIGLAEDRGLIVPLGEWVLREACTAARRWPGIRIAVNVSPTQFRETNFVERVTEIVAQTGLDASRLELELTEGVLADYESATLSTMAHLRGQGIRLAIDDFGTSFSNLIYLRRFTVDKIKIDRAFVDDVEPDSPAAVLLASMVGLGHALGLAVTVEGIETLGQQDLLRQIGCDQLQGYLIARPLPEPEFAAFLKTRQPEGESEPRLHASA